MKDRKLFTVKKLALFAISIIFLSVVLSVIIDTDPNLYEGQPVVIIVGTERVPGHIYNIRGDGRYVIRYLNNRSEPVTASFKRFEFETIEDINTN